MLPPHGAWVTEAIVSLDRRICVATVTELPSLILTSFTSELALPISDCRDNYKLCQYFDAGDCGISVQLWS